MAGTTSSAAGRANAGSVLLRNQMLTTIAGADCERISCAVKPLTSPFGGALKAKHRSVRNS
ncbi:MAG: hypothetical protein RR365_07155 [Bacteroides sp.]